MRNLKEYLLNRRNNWVLSSSLSFRSFPEISIEEVRRFLGLQAIKKLKGYSLERLWRVNFGEVLRDKTPQVIGAYINDEIVGAVWAGRPQEIISYGYSEIEEPELMVELSLELKEEYKEYGIATELYMLMMEVLMKTKVDSILLSVRKRNYSYQIYDALGFHVLNNVNGYIWLEKLKERIDRKNEKHIGEDFSNSNLRNMDFTGSDFEKCTFCGTDFTNSKLRNVRAEGCSFENANFSNAIISGGSFRYANLKNANFSGTVCNYALFEYAELDGITTDEYTRNFGLRCPIKGAFIGYKKCEDGRIVTLLILEESLRTSATWRACRTNKAKVLKVESMDERVTYKEAYSLAKEGFCYKVGEVVEVEDFNTDRWIDSTTGIHFFMTKEEARGY
ncbi:MAG: pentapeptide repeat-containing protein [Filifactoraceae bacterium]